jgi:hypothetical protein
MRAFLMSVQFIQFNILFLIIHPDKKVYIAKFANILKSNRLANYGIKKCKLDNERGRKNVKDD